MNQEKAHKPHPKKVPEIDNARESHQAGVRNFEAGRYRDAQKDFEKTLATLERVAKNEYITIAVVLRNLASCHKKQANYSEAEALYLRSLAICDQTAEIDLLSKAATLQGLGDLYAEQGLYEDARAALTRALTTYEEAAGDHHLDIASALNSLGELHAAQGDFRKAENLHRQALAIRDNNVNASDHETASSLNNLALACKMNGRHKESELLHERALSICERKLGKIHPLTATTLSNLGTLYAEQGSLCKAADLLGRALAIKQEILGPRHPDLASTLNNLAVLYSQQGLYQESEETLAQSLAITKDILGSDHPHAATILCNLAQACIRQGKLSKAETLYSQSLRICEKKLDINHPQIAEILNGLATIYEDSGFYSKSESLYRKALAIAGQSCGEESSLCATILNNLAKLNASQGLYRQAEELYNRALAIHEKMQGDHHPAIGALLNNIGNVLIHRGLYERAEACYTRAFRIYTNALGSDHPYIATTMDNLAQLYCSVGFYSQAEMLYRRALAIRETAPWLTHRDTAICLTNLAFLYLRQGFLRKAEPVYKQAMSIFSESLGNNHPLTTKSMNNLACLYIAQRKYSSAVHLFQKSLYSELKWLHQEIPLAASANRSFLLDTFQSIHQPPLELALKDQRFLELILFARLNFHGILQEIEKWQLQIAKASESHQDIVEQLKTITTALASGQLDAISRQEKEKARDQLESELFHVLPKPQLGPVEVEDVQAILPENSALIEFQRYKPILDHESIEPLCPRYMALLLLPFNQIRAVDLGPAEVIEDAIESARTATIGCFAEALDTWHCVSEKLITPLLPYLEKVKCWYFSLDAELHRIPFQILPWPERQDHLIVESHEIRLVTSGRDLLGANKILEPPRSPKAGLVVADPAFDNSSACLIRKDVASSNYQSRSRDMNLLKHWQPLPGTAKEGKEVSRLLGADLKTGINATTSTVKQAKGPRFLHIATHGFFLIDLSKLDTGDGLSSSTSDAITCKFHGEDPLLRSGLVFAGANNPVSDPEEDDGYLTALEAIHLDLRGTELVTLSACDTGRGDIHIGEGVYGLQRALIVAGARSMLLSLWPVSDEATCAFMVRFYTLLKQGAGRYQALMGVQKEFREHANIVWRHPYYWGAWQLIGDWRPIPHL